MRKMKLRTCGAKYYSAYDPGILVYSFLMSALLVCAPLVILKVYGLDVLRSGIIIPLIFLAGILGIWMISMLQIVRIDERGITLYTFLRKRKVILWRDVCCCGSFFHITYIGRKKKFFYFSTKPLRGGVNYLRLTKMAKQTDSFLYVAEQRDAERVIKLFFQSSSEKHWSPI